MTINQQRMRFVERYCRTPKETAACSAYVKQWWPEETAHRIRIADEVMGRTFLFDLPWDMEQTARPVTFPEQIDWMYQPGDDPEFIYQMNRHRYWVCLGQAYAMSGREHYASAFAAQMLHWIAANPITEETRPKTWRTIEAGLRGENWIKAMGYFAVSPAVTDAIFGAFVAEMVRHGEYLAACDVPFSTKSNWGVLENSGLYAIGSMLEHIGGHPEGAEFVRLARKRLVRQIQVQVMDDGVHWEQSPMYHNEVLHCYLEALRTAALSGDTFPEPMVDKVRAMARVNRVWQKPDGSQPSCGDSDVTDLRDVLTVFAYLFQSPELKSGGFERMDYEGVWDYGMASVSDYEALPVRVPEKTCIWLKDSGNGYLRSSWNADADYLHLRCGSLGGGHGHFDKGHMDLVIQGEEILIDPGRYTYVDGDARRSLKSAKAHNSVTVDGTEYTACLDSWGVKGLLPAVGGSVCQKGEYTLMECGHLGYMDRGVYVERRVLAIGTRIYLVMDTCYGTGIAGGSVGMQTAKPQDAGQQARQFSCEQHFHLAPELRVSMTPEGFVAEGKRSRVRFVPVSENAVWTEEAFDVSRHYNQKEPGRMVTVSRSGRGTVTMVTAILCEPTETQDMEMRDVQAQDVQAQVVPEQNRPIPEADGSHGPATVRKVPVTAPVGGRTLTDEEAEGVEITCGAKRWLVIHAHVEAGADCEYIGAEGYYGLGRVMACKRSAKADEASQGERALGGEMVVLRW